MWGRHMRVLGITGGVGSGKSRVLYDLKTRHKAFVIEADKLAHELYEPGKMVYQRVVEVFEKDILSDDLTIDRKKLGELVFSNEEKLKILNSILHPAVKDEIKLIIEREKEKGRYPLLVIEAALLIQDGYSEICDEIWYIYVSRAERVKRLMRQRGYTEEKCKLIFSSQAPDEFYEKNADFIINNENDYNFTAEQVNVRLKKFLKNDIIGSIV